MGSNNAAAAAQQQENQRQANISSNVNQIDAAFAQRQPQYTQYLNAARGVYQTELGRQQQIAGRNMNFALARNGMAGSSVAADQGDELGREMAQGSIQAEQKAQSGLSQLESQDQAEKQQLISLAQSGSDIGSGAMMAGDQMQANLGAAMSGATASGLGDMFGSATQAYTNFNNAAMARKGINNSYQYMYGNSAPQARGSGFGS